MQNLYVLGAHRSPSKLRSSCGYKLAGAIRMSYMKMFGTKLSIRWSLLVSLTPCLLAQSGTAPLKRFAYPPTGLETPGCDLLKAIHVSNSETSGTVR
jgi:hypothetical protein